MQERAIGEGKRGKGERGKRGKVRLYPESY
jgi:hypothetical protein